MPCKFYGCFRHETCGREDCSKIAKFWVKTTSHGYRLGMLTFKICFKISQLVTNHECMAMTLKANPNYPNGSMQKNKDRKKLDKYGQKCRFCSLFSSIAMAWFIMNSCHKVVRSIRNTTLKLCADCAKQFVRNAQNYGKTNHGFCIIITHQLTHWCLEVSFWPKTKP